VERLASFRADLPGDLGPEIAIYGEPYFVVTVAERLEMSLLSPPDDWLASLSREQLGRTVRYMPLAQAREITPRAFFKPADEKCFPARVYASGAELPPPDELDGGVPCLVSDPVRWESEFRCFALAGSVRAISIYSRDGDLAQSEEGDWPADPGDLEDAGKFAEDVLAASGSRLPRAVVIDVGRIAGFGWAVVEANAAWGSGIYGCDPAAVLDVVRASCVPGVFRPGQTSGNA
jgi:hypothetical protein